MSMTKVTVCTESVPADKTELKRVRVPLKVPNLIPQMMFCCVNVQRVIKIQQVLKEAEREERHEKNTGRKGTKTELRTNAVGNDQ